MPGDAAGIARPRALVFDWDNTLVDSWPVIHGALVETLEAMGHAPWTLEETKDRVRLSLRDSFPKLFGDRWETARQIYLDAFTRVHIERLTPLPGTAQLLADLEAAGFYLAVVSNKTGRLLRKEAEALGWSRHFGRIVGATDATADKPDAAPVRLALEPLGVAPDRATWLVGDTAIDMECAGNAGCVGVLLGDVDPAGVEFARHPPQLAFTRPEALFLHLRTL